MGAYRELQAGGMLDAEGAQLLYATVAAVVRMDRYPPEDADRWTRGSLQALAHDFLTDEAAPARLASLALRSSDDASLARLLQAAVRAWLRDRGRRRDVGPLRRRVGDILRDMPDVSELASPAGALWALDDMTDVELWAGDAADLIAVAWDIGDVNELRWRSETRRDPIADRRSFETLLTAVLKAAGAPVAMSTLVDIIAARFALAAPPLVVDLDDEPGRPFASAESEALRDVRTAEIWNQLSTRERLLLSYYGEPVRDVAAALGLGKSATAVAINRLEGHLQLLLHGERDVEEIWHRLEEMGDDFRRRPDS